MHDQHPSKSRIDLNRTGVALMEIVSRPDMRFLDRGGGLCAQAALHSALFGNL